MSTWLLRICILLCLPSLVSRPNPGLNLVPGVPEVEIGEASWYGPWHEGRTTASGEVFHMSRLTSAHPTWPLGSIVRVTSLRTGRTVVVRLNDRGPFVDSRVIDLSRAAARKLDLVERGIEPVLLELLSAEPG